MSRDLFDHHEECDLLMVDEGGHCTCPDEDDPPYRQSLYEAPVWGEDRSPHDDRLAGPAMDW